MKNVLNGNARWVGTTALAVVGMLTLWADQRGRVSAVGDLASTKLETLRIENKHEHELISQMIQDKWNEHKDIRQMIHNLAISNNEELRRQAVLMARIAEKVGVPNN